ncbi:hypothetical protein [Hamadaea tsunoensis]|uniref:hypothetical protein n=1 Tax=Hamadaea tsunoensis TaxID=53368 RepID=UPI00041AE16A|nr:hypothetical protein [Hamadaea tsunoensis]
MTARLMTLDDVDWAVEVLRRRREPLVRHAPLFWRPAPDAAERHRDHLAYVLGVAGGRGYRTDRSVLIAAARGDGVLVDDAYAEEEDWAGDGRLLWAALAADAAGTRVRFVCPTHERRRAGFARTAGLNRAESWWLREIEGSAGGTAGVEIDLPGAMARTVAAPPVYAPPGPVLFLTAVTDPRRALPAAVERAAGLGCAAVVVSQEPAGQNLGADLLRAAFRRHCDYFTGTVRAPVRPDDATPVTGGDRPA